MTPAPPAPENLAALDIGTNSVHGIVARMTPDEDGPRFEVLDREKAVVRLGSSAGDMRELDDAAIDRAVAALARFRQVAEAHGAPIRAVATSATREAENRHEFLRRAWHEAGVRVEVISGVEEARLIYLGVLQAVPVFERRILLCDIGGGSTELLVGHRGEMLTARSLKLGAIRLTERFFGGQQLHPGSVDACRRHVRSTLAPMVREVHDAGIEVAVGSSGTIAALATMAAMRDGGPRPRTVRNLVLPRARLDDVVADLAAAPTPDDRAGLAGLDPGRADIILGGAIILEQVMHELGIEELLVSDHALREGVLLDTWRRRHGGSLHHLSDLRRRSVLDLAQLMDSDPEHSAQVARLALALFDETSGRHGLGDDARELLEAAALLCNVGLFLSHSQHHKHSAYVIRSTDRLAGFTDREVELISLVARYHRKAEPKAKHPEWAVLDESDQHMVRCLAGILRVAIGLDRNHAGRVASVEAVGDGDGLRIRVTERPGEDVSLELYAASTRKELLEAALGAPIELEQASSQVASGSTP
jgi:exopolyphosphatase/guanosine-5'-triphosphate,3'-diphosphate pyrophosphatase